MTTFGPLLIVVAGPPASGKTTLATALALELPALLVEQDDVARSLGALSSNPPDGKEVRRVLLQRLAKLANDGVPTVAAGAFTASFGDEVTRITAYATVRLLVCATPPELCHQRYAVRAARRRGTALEALDNHAMALMDRGEFDWSAFELKADVPTLTVATDPEWSPDLPHVVRFCRADN